MTMGANNYWQMLLNMLEFFTKRPAAGVSPARLPQQTLAITYEERESNENCLTDQRWSNR